ncbi:MULTISPECIES: GerMN domain-containing protein [unclassified Caldicellulosiruptor]|uniref:GerMN domain-containing protein n=1 Tax=unclassified Caldicellulosiruptor TaxID=2622462 RepID=UPI0003AAA5D6|nr:MULTISPECIES: GerMN domain-containing protein [unclassified Caldicellulosiruptor]
MRKRIFFMLILCLIFLTACSADILPSTIRSDVYRTGQNAKTEIDFEVVDSDVYTPQYSKEEIDTNNSFKVLSIFCDKDKNLVLANIYTTRTLSAMRKGLELSIFSPQKQKKLRDFGLFCIFPDDIHINSIEIEGNCAKVDLNQKFFQKKYSNFYIKAITFFITSVNGIIKEVCFYKDGTIYNKTPLLRRQDDQLILFVPQRVEGNVFLVPKWINISQTYRNAPLTFALGQLIKSLSYRFSKLNGLKLNNVNLKEKTLYLDLSSQILNLKGSSEVDTILASICFTAKEIDNSIRYIKLSVKGKEGYLDQYDLKDKIDVSQFELNPINLKL